MPDDRIFDGGEAFRLSAGAHGGLGPAWSDVKARAVLARWLRREPQRTQLRRIAARAGGAPLDANLPDEQLLALLLARLRAGHIAIVPAERERRYGVRELVPTGEGEDHLTVGEIVDQFRPCDFEVVVLTCKHMGGEDRTMTDARFWKEGSLTQDNLPAPTGNYSPTKVLSVTGNDAERAADDITVKLEGGPGYGCSRNHPKITIKDKTGWSEVHKGETTVKFKAKTRRLEVPPAVALGAPWAVVLFHYFPDLTNTYTLDVESCGRLDAGEYGFGRSQHQVKCYSDDRYALKVAIPPMKKTSFERARMKHPDGTLAVSRKLESESFTKGEKVSESRTEKSGPGGYESVDSYEYKTRDGALSEKVTTVTGEGQTREDGEGDGLDGVGKAIVKGISFTRNGADIEEAAKLGEIINTIADLKKTVQSIADFIKDFQPQVGWKFTFEMELFAGELAAEWGYKEWVDHTVYSAWKFQVEMTLFMLKLEVSFGASLKVWRWEITALIFGNVKVEAKLGASYESTPNSSKPFEVGVEGGPQGELGIRAVLGDSWVKCEGKLTVGIKFEAKAKMSSSDPFHIDWALHGEGVKAKVKASLKWVGSYERTWKLVEPRKNWKKGTFPAAKKQLSA
ncbi:MAG: hypothetical protein AB8I08_37945 [Sandaracinaceae bacterium]